MSVCVLKSTVIYYIVVAYCHVAVCVCVCVLYIVCMAGVCDEETYLSLPPSSSSPSPHRVVHRSLSHCSCQLLPRADYDEDDDQVHWHTPHCCLRIIVSSIAEGEREQEQEGEKEKRLSRPSVSLLFAPFILQVCTTCARTRREGGRDLLISFA